MAISLKNIYSGGSSTSSSGRFNTGGLLNSTTVTSGSSGTIVNIIGKKGIAYIDTSTADSSFSSEVDVTIDGKVLPTLSVRSLSYLFSGGFKAAGGVSDAYVNLPLIDFETSLKIDLVTPPLLPYNIVTLET